MLTSDTSQLTHAGVEVYTIRRFDTSCYVHILDLDHVNLKLVNGFMAVPQRAESLKAQLAFNANGWGLQKGNASLSNEYLVIEGVVIQATAIDYRPCMHISKNGVIEFLDHPNFNTAWNVIGFDRYIARHGVYNSAIQNNTPDPRTVYGVDASGCLIVLVCEGRREEEKGLTFAECWSVLQEFGCTDCGNADGGYSSCAYNETLNGLLNETYKVEYRHTVMQVLAYTRPLGEVPPEEPGDTMTYQMRTIGDTNMRAQPNTAAAKLLPSNGVLANSTLSGDELFTAISELKNSLGVYQKVGDKWLKVTYGGVTGWVAYIHMGSPICDNFTENPVEPPPTPTPTGIDININQTPNGHYTVKVDGTVVFTK